MGSAGGEAPWPRDAIVCAMCRTSRRGRCPCLDFPTMCRREQDSRPPTGQNARPRRSEAAHGSQRNHCASVSCILYMLRPSGSATCSISSRFNIYLLSHLRRFCLFIHFLNFCNRAILFFDIYFFRKLFKIFYFCIRIFRFS